MAAAEDAKLKTTLQVSKLDLKFIFKMLAISLDHRGARAAALPAPDKQYLQKMGDQLWKAYTKSFGKPTKEELGYRV